MNIEIANRLVNLRKQNNLSQEALAEKLGISRQAVSKWERAEASPDTDNLILLARLYGVSLDELLKTEDEIPMPEPEETEKGQEDDRKEETENFGQDCREEDTYYEDVDGKKVHIGKDGIHVQEHGGDEVHVGWDGIHVNEGGEEVVWTNRDGFGGMEPKLRFPVGLIICIAYLIVGIAYNAWHPGWLLLLWIPILESLITAVKRRNASRFAYPIAALLFFLSYRIFAGSWMGWIAFLTIPIYYSLVSYIKSLLHHRRWKKAQKVQRTEYREVREEE